MLEDKRNEPAVLRRNQYKSTLAESSLSALAESSLMHPQWRYFRSIELCLDSIRCVEIFNTNADHTPPPSPAFPSPIPLRPYLFLLFSFMHRIQHAHRIIAY